MTPALAGIANALFPGLGYLLIKERVVFGALVLVVTVAYLILMFIEPTVYGFDAPVFFSETTAGIVLEAIMMIVSVAAFGYDAYDLAKKKKALV